MKLSAFELFRIGIGPSSSHTVGPMRAARQFVSGLSQGRRVCRIQVTLYGSLALTGEGHGTDRAVIYGLLGHEPETIDLEIADREMAKVYLKGQLKVGSSTVCFEPLRDIRWAKTEFQPEYANALTFAADLEDGSEVTRTFFSIGGGFLLERGGAPEVDSRHEPEMPFSDAQSLLKAAESAGLRIPTLVRRNEERWHAPIDVDHGLDRIWDEMSKCIDRGLVTRGTLPGGLGVPRRAADLYSKLQVAAKQEGPPPTPLDWASIYAIAVNEENAAGHRVVTAPTNGAAGVVPAVIRYYVDFCHGSAAGIREFLLTAAAIGAIVKKNASISGADIGCQGEVGTACGMAAAGLTAALNGTNAQIENAAEIGIEHHLGLSCDPVNGLVQVPCIERNAMGAVKAINACSLAMRGDGKHLVSLDDAIATMRETGADMNMKYKETSLGGLAVRVTIAKRLC